MANSKIEWNGDFTEAEVFLQGEVEGTKMTPFELSEFGVVVLEAERRGIKQRNFLRSKQSKPIFKKGEQ